MTSEKEHGRQKVSCQIEFLLLLIIVIHLLAHLDKISRSDSQFWTIKVSLALLICHYFWTLSRYTDTNIGKDEWLAWLWVSRVHKNSFTALHQFCALALGPGKLRYYFGLKGVLRPSRIWKPVSGLKISIGTKQDSIQSCLSIHL